MKRIKFFLVATCLFVFCFANAQHVKPRFKKLLYVVYRPDDSAKNLSISIDYYLVFNGDGTLHYVSNAYDGLLDTTYKIPDTLTVVLNKVFNGQKKLKTYMIRDKFAEGDHFAGPLEFISYTDNNNLTDNIIVVDGFMNEIFDKLLNKINYLPSANTYHHGEVIKNKLIESEVIKFHKACKYIPKIEEPPKLMELKN